MTACVWTRTRYKTAKCAVCGRRATWVHLDADSDTRTAYCLGCATNNVSADCGAALVNTCFQPATSICALGTVCLVIGLVFEVDLLRGIGIPLAAAGIVLLATRLRYTARIQARASVESEGGTS